MNGSGFMSLWVEYDALTNVNVSVLADHIEHGHTLDRDSAVEVTFFNPMWVLYAVLGCCRMNFRKN